MGPERTLSIMNTQATALFAQFDCDRSGGLDHAELMVALNALGLYTDPAQSAAILSRFDTDGNGRLEVGEVRPCGLCVSLDSDLGSDTPCLLLHSCPQFCKLHDELCDFFSTAQKAQLAPPDDVTRIFETFDVDNSHAIESRELLAALRSLWLPHIDVTEAAQIFNRYDTDGNGRLDAEEFRRLVEDLRTYVRSTRS